LRLAYTSLRFASLAMSRAHGSLARKKTMIMMSTRLARLIGSYVAPAIKRRAFRPFPGTSRLAIAKAEIDRQLTRESSTDANSLGE
jgi:hypothetical protein